VRWKTLAVGRKRRKQPKRSARGSKLQALCHSGWRRANVTIPTAFLPGISCACKDDPHTIAYHGGVRLSSASRTSLSNQPVAFLLRVEYGAIVSSFGNQ